MIISSMVKCSLILCLPYETCRGIGLGQHGLASVGTLRSSIEQVRRELDLKHSRCELLQVSSVKDARYKNRAEQ